MRNKKHVMKALNAAGDGAADLNLNGDYSSGPIWAHWKNNTGHNCKINKIIIKIEDRGSMDVDSYGNGITLTEGLRFFIRDQNNDVIEELTSYPLLTSGDMAGHCDVKEHSFGSGNNVISVQWTLWQSGGAVSLKPHESIGVLLADDFSGLIDHKFNIQGVEIIA